MLGNNHLGNTFAEVNAIKTWFASAKPWAIADCWGEFWGLSSLIWLSVFIMLFVKCFFCNIWIYYRCFFKQKYPWKKGQNVYMEKNVSPKWDVGFMKVGSLLGVGEFIFMYINRFWFFTKILLYGEISFYRDSHFAGMTFPHTNNPLDKWISKYLIISEKYLRVSTTFIAVMWYFSF